MSPVDILENIVFWCLVLYIAWNQSRTPDWAYIALFVFLVYFLLRTIFKKQGIDRAVWLYSLNMLVILYLMSYFLRK